MTVPVLISVHLIHAGAASSSHAANASANASADANGVLAPSADTNGRQEALRLQPACLQAGAPSNFSEELVSSVLLTWGESLVDVNRCQSVPRVYHIL